MHIIRGINVNSVFQLLSAYILCCCVHIQSAIYCVHSVMLEFILLHVSTIPLSSIFEYHVHYKQLWLSNILAAYTSTSSGMKNAGFHQNKCQPHFETTHWTDWAISYHHTIKTPHYTTEIGTANHTILRS
jgi:hypothetical protein